MISDPYDPWIIAKRMSSVGFWCYTTRRKQGEILRSIAYAGLPFWMLLASCTLLPASVAVIDYYDYGALAPTLSLLPEGQVHVEDLRVEVLSGEMKPSYVGHAEDGFGDKSTVTNTDGCPLPHTVHSTQRCKSFAESLKARLVDVGMAPDASKGSLFILINEWHTDAVTGVKLTYDLSAVHTRNNQIVERAHIKGQGELVDTQKIRSIHFSNHEQAEAELSRILVKVLDTHLKQLIAGKIEKSIRHSVPAGP
jgi:hypothetical protein